MQLFVEVPLDITEWFERLDDVRKLRDLLGVSRKCVVIANQKGDQRSLLKSIRDIPSESAKVVLESFATALPAAWHAEEPVSVIRIGSLDDAMTTLDAVKDEGFFDSFEDGNFSIDPGTTRERAYREKFESLAKIARSVEIYDPYLSRHIVTSSRNPDGKLWWLRKLMENKKLNITIISTCPKESYYKNFIPTLHEALAQLESSIGPREAILKVETFEENSAIFHNRTLRFRFDQNDVAVESNNSFDRYSTENISQRLTLNRISGQVVTDDRNFYKDKLKQFETLLVRGGAISHVAS